MKKHPFEINVAFIGYVSVGKTTLLNALFREQYSEVSMKRTTAAVNKFRISFREPAAVKQNDDKQVKKSSEKSDTGVKTTEEECEDDKKQSANAPDMVEDTDNEDPDAKEIKKEDPSTDIGAKESEERPKKPRDQGLEEVKQSEEEDEAGNATSDEEKQPSFPDTDEHKTAGEILKEISQDNQIFRDSSTLQEKTFDIQLDEEPWFEMRQNTKLVLVDVPGINEAGTLQKYKYYVTKQWDKFGCVVVVLDGRQGVNTQEQIDLLKFVDHQRRTVKDVSVIVAFNKVDDPEETEQSQLIKEARSEVERIFDITSSEQVLQNILEGTQPRYSATSKSPVTIMSISAIHAFIYRSASRLNYEDFEEKIDPSLLDKMGRDSYGRRWNRFERTEKIRKAYDLIKDPEEYKDGIHASNYHCFSAALAHCVGGTQTQEDLLRSHVLDDMSRLSHESDFVSELTTICYKLERLGLSPKEANSKTFRTCVDLLEKSIKKVFKDFEKPNDVHTLAEPMKQLYQYALRCKTNETWVGNSSDIIVMAKKMVLMQISCFLNFYEQFVDKSVTPSEFVVIYGQILDAANAPWFTKYFGNARLLLNRLFHIASHASASDDALAFQYSDEVEDLIPCHPRTHEKQIRSKIVQHPSDPNHFGHLIWMFGKILHLSDTNDELLIGKSSFSEECKPENASFDQTDSRRGAESSSPFSIGSSISNSNAPFEFFSTSKSKHRRTDRRHQVAPASFNFGASSLSSECSQPTASSHGSNNIKGDLKSGSLSATGEFSFGRAKSPLHSFNPDSTSSGVFSFGGASPGKFSFGAPKPASSEVISFGVATNPSEAPSMNKVFKFGAAIAAPPAPIAETNLP